MLLSKQLIAPPLVLRHSIVRRRLRHLLKSPGPLGQHVMAFGLEKRAARTQTVRGFAVQPVQHMLQWHIGSVIEVILQ